MCCNIVGPCNCVMHSTVLYLSTVKNSRQSWRQTLATSAERSPGLHTCQVAILSGFFYLTIALLKTTSLLCSSDHDHGIHLTVDAKFLQFTLPHVCQVDIFWEKRFVWGQKFNLARVSERSLKVFIFVVASAIVSVLGSWIYLYLHQCPTDKIIADMDTIVQSLDNIHDSLDAIATTIGTV